MNDNLQPGETEAQREARIYADCFRPFESDLDYVIRRGKERGIDLEHLRERQHDHEVES